jgi:hypothetical protein
LPSGLSSGELLESDRFSSPELLRDADGVMLPWLTASLSALRIGLRLKDALVMDLGASRRTENLFLAGVTNGTSGVDDPDDENANTVCPIGVANGGGTWGVKESECCAGEVPPLRGCGVCAVTEN